MEIPDNCQCYCYAIMSSLCFPCQVKVHLLHLTASPHGELIKNVKCPTPKDRYRSPESAGKDRSQTPNSPDREDVKKADCGNCEYYMNFINKLTSGLCEEKILRMVCSNPCLISSTLPGTPAGASDYTSKSSPDEPPLSNMAGNVVTKLAKQKVPSKTGLKSNATTGSRDHPLPTINNEVPTVNDNLGKKKSEISAEKKPTTPTNLMTTDKILKRSFDSIAKNRPSPIPSRTPSPEKKRPEIKRTTVTDPKPMKSLEPKIDGTPVKKYNKSSTLQKSSPSSTLSKPSKNENATRQMASKETVKKLSTSEGKGSVIPGKRTLKDAPVKPRNPQLNSPVTAKKTPNPTETADDKKNKCNDEVCAFVPGMHHNAGKSKGQYGNKDGMKKIVDNNKDAKAMDIGSNTTYETPPTGEFFEAALVMGFYQPPQLGNMRSKHATKPLHEEYKNEPSNPNLGDSIMRQFCQKPKIESTREEPNEVNNVTEYNSKQQALYEQNVGRKQQTMEEHLPPTHYTTVEEYVECLPLEREDTTRKNKNQEKTKSSQGSKRREFGEEKTRKNAKPITDPKKHDATSTRRKSHTPIHEKVIGNRAYYQETGIDGIGADEKPVQDSDVNRKVARTVAGPIESTHFAKARQREERGRDPTSVGTGKDEPIPKALTRDAAETSPETGMRRNSILDDRRNHMTETHPPNGTRTSPPAKILGENYCQPVNNDRQIHARELPKTRKADLSTAKEAAEDIPNWKTTNDTPNIREYIPPNSQRLEYSSNTSQRTKEDSQPSKRTGRNTERAEGTERNRERIDDCEMDSKGHRGRLSIDGEERPVQVGVIKKIREEIESDFKRSAFEKQVGCDPEYSPTFKKKRTEESPRYLGDTAPSHSEGKSSRTGSPIQKKSRSPNQRHSASCTSVDDATRVYPQFSEYMNPDAEGYKSKSAGNVVESHSAHDPIEIPPAKSKSERGSSGWSCGVCPDDKRVYYHTDSEGKCTSMVIGLPQDGRNSNPHIRINFSKQIRQDIALYKVDKCEQKYDYRDTGTQCDNDLTGRVSPEGSRPATAKSSKNRVPEKTSAKPLQASGPTPSAKPAQNSGYQQMFYNRPLMRRSFQ